MNLLLLQYYYSCYNQYYRSICFVRYINLSKHCCAGSIKLDSVVYIVLVRKCAYTLIMDISRDILNNVIEDSDSEIDNSNADVSYCSE